MSAEVAEATTEVAGTTTEVTETQTVTTKTVEDGGVIVTETTTTITTTKEAVKEDSVPDKDEVKENGGTEVSKEETPATQEETADKIEVEGQNEEEQAPKLILHQFPPGRNIPSLSSFCLKLETFFRINKIPYENSYGWKVGKKGKIPWIEYKGEKMADSNFIIDYFNKTFEINLEKNLSSAEKAQARSFMVMLEENTYWTLVFQRWVDSDSVDEWKKLIQPSSAGLGFQITFKMNQGKLRRELDQHGMGRHSKKEIYDIAEKDLKALSDFLADKEFLLGSQPTTVDASAFGLLANILLSGVEGPQSKFIKVNLQNLVDFTERIKNAYWNDWQDVTAGHDTSITKTCSFRRSKKSKDDKEEDKEEDTDVTEENKVGETDIAGEDTEVTEKTEPSVEGAKPSEEGEAENKDDQSESQKIGKGAETLPQEVNTEVTPHSEELTPHVNGEATTDEQSRAESKSD